MSLLSHKGPVLLLGLLVVAGGASCGRYHPQNEGTYVLHLDQVIRDDCHLYAGPDSLGSVNLHVYGNTLLMDFPLDGIQMKGVYQPTEESFLADGSAANVETSVQGQQCLVELVSVHVDATSDSVSAFQGSLRINYQTHAPSSCICQLTATYHATQQ